AARTLHALAAQNVCGEDLAGHSGQSIALRLAEMTSPAWFLRAGSWPLRPAPAAALPTSKTGGAPCGPGATSAAPGMDVDQNAADWNAVLRENGGHFNFSGNEPCKLPPLDSFYLEPVVIAAVAARLRRGEEFVPAVIGELSAANRRVVRAAALD